MFRMVAMWEGVNTYRGRVPVQGDEVGQARLCYDVRLKPHKHYVVLWDVRDLHKPAGQLSGDLHPVFVKHSMTALDLPGICQLLLACAKAQLASHDCHRPRVCWRWSWHNSLNI